MEKIIFFGLVIPILGFVLYLGATAIMKGFSAKSANKANERSEIEKIDEFSDDENKLSDEIEKLNEESLVHTHWAIPSHGVSSKQMRSLCWRTAV